MMDAKATVVSTPLAQAEAPALARLDARAHLAPLDGIRGLAIVIVLFGHICESIVKEWGFVFPGIQAGLLGWTGVDLFFVLSGFLITGILYESRNGEHYFRNFYARRALRIFPLYYGVLLLVLIASTLGPRFLEWRWESQAWLWLYLTNFKLAFGHPGMFGVLDHFWSLAIEEHYYLVWPAIVYAFHRRTLMKILLAAMAIAFTVRLLSIEGERMTLAGYMMTPARMDALAAGSFIALAARGPGGIAALVKPAFLAFGLAGAAFVSIVLLRNSAGFDDPVVGTVGISLLWAMFGGLLVISLTWQPAVAVMSSGLLRWFGKYSYGMYVWHPVVIIILLHTPWARGLRTGALWVDIVGGVAVSLAGVFAVSVLSWHLWEKQFLKMKRHFE